MEWLALLQLLLPLIEMLLKLFANRPKAAERTRIAAALVQCNEAVATMTPAERHQHARLIKRLERANSRAKAFGIEV